MTNPFLPSIQGLFDILRLPPVREIHQDHLSQDERGYSGAEVRRISVTCADGSLQSAILKCTPLEERLAMETLTRQNRRHTPAAFSANTLDPGPEWMAQEDLGPVRAPVCPTPQWMRSAAAALAQIHFDNLQKGDSLPWLPRADGAYWRRLLTQLTVDHFAAKIEQSPAFAREFGPYLSPLRARAEQFERDMTALWRESDSLTLTHGDLQTADGDHIRNCGGRPRIIDFGFCRYAPFYIDLASYFTLAEAESYHAALTALGFPLKKADFRERLRAAAPYAGFVYLFPALMQWGDGPTEQTGRRLLQLLKIIFSGDFPERRNHYSDSLFAALLAQHRAGELQPH